MNITYETHSIIKENKLCPFKYLSASRIDRGRCNWHKNVEIILTTDGVGNVQYGGETLQLARDDITVVNSDVIHRFSDEKNFVFAGIIIDDGFCVDNGFDVKKITFERCFTDAWTRKLFTEAASSIIKYSRTEATIDAAKARLATLELLIDLAERHTVNKISAVTPVKRSTEEYIKLAIKHLGEHFTEPLRLDEISRICGVTKYHLIREFKRFTGTTVCTYTNLLRCQRAETCILEGMSITDAALESGFESLSYFSRTYKKLKGKLPSTIKQLSDQARMRQNEQKESTV